MQQVGVFSAFHLASNSCQIDAVYRFDFLAVFLDFLNADSVGAPLLPGFLIRSPEPAFMRLRFA
jgi:hypothetical protein